MHLVYPSVKQQARKYVWQHPRQQGAVLILLAFIIGIGALAYLLHALDPQQARIEQDKHTMQTLNAAKQALLAWSVSHVTHPGQMPFPDRGTGGGYDGKSDCNPPNNNPLQYNFLIGQLPIYGQTNPCIAPQTGIGSDFRDAQGNRFWYAVSRNLTHKYETDPFNTNPVEPIINPSVIDNPMYPWLKVLDRNGILISDHVAAVIIAPSNPVGGQSRTAVAAASEFLDTVKIGANTYSNADYTKPEEDFIVGEDSRDVGDKDTTFVAPYNFNDKLVYITIEELLSALNARAVGEAKNLLKLYQTKTGQFPYAAALGATVNNFIASPPNQQGMLPVDGTDDCVCNTFQSCTCDFKPIINVTFTKNSGTWQLASGACTRNGSLCTCTGAGSCSRNTINFSCTSAGLCTTSQTGVNLFTYTLPSYADATPNGVGCFLNGSQQPACNSAGGFSIGLKESDWFKDNFWEDYFYYSWSSLANLQVGSQTGIGALLIGTGKAIIAPPYAVKGSPQIRPSVMITDYLDSIENTNGDSRFDASNQPKSENYNDQVTIVAP